MDHPITPPPELVKRWRASASDIAASWCSDPRSWRDYIDYIANQASQWGADQELEACCAEVSWFTADKLRAARRPKPPSLKEQALAALGYLQEDEPNYQSSFDTIRRALEALPND